MRSGCHYVRVNFFAVTESFSIKRYSVYAECVAAVTHFTFFLRISPFKKTPHHQNLIMRKTAYHEKTFIVEVHNFYWKYIAAAFCLYDIDEVKVNDWWTFVSFFCYELGTIYDTIENDMRAPGLYVRDVKDRDEWRSRTTVVDHK